MRSRLSTTGVLVGLLIVLTAGAASAALAVAGPGSFQAQSFTTPVVIAPPGGPVMFTNDDLYPHNFAAFDTFLSKKDAKSADWCSRFKKGKCPAFWSETINQGQVTDVLGIDKLPSGQYAFYCQLHPRMQGTLIVP